MIQTLKRICLRCGRTWGGASVHPWLGARQEEGNNASIYDFVCSAILAFLRGNSHQPISVHIDEMD